LPPADVIAGVNPIRWKIMLALSIRQPYAEEILRGIKKVEYWNQPTRIVGVEFYIYAAMKAPSEPDTTARFAKLGAKPGELPTGLLVGKAKFSKCVRCSGSGDGGFDGYEWHFSDVKRLDKPIKPKKHPQPTWFKPF
jgi:hypothetical protein